MNETENNGFVRTFDDVVQALREDPTWELPPEDREMTLMDLAWTLIDF